MTLWKRPEALSLLAIAIALMSVGYAKGIVGYEVWTTDADYNFPTQILMPRIGLIISSFIGACGALSIVSKYDNHSDMLGSLIMFIVGVGILIYGFWEWHTEYQVIISVFGPPLIGAGMFMFIRNRKPLKNRIVSMTLAVIAIIPALALAAGGKPSAFDVWQFIVVLNGGTGLLILLAALSGSLVMNNLLHQQAC